MHTHTHVHARWRIVRIVWKRKRKIRIKLVSFGRRCQFSRSSRTRNHSEEMVYRQFHSSLLLFFPSRDFSFILSCVVLSAVLAILHLTMKYLSKCHLDASLLVHLEDRRRALAAVVAVVFVHYSNWWPLGWPDFRWPSSRRDLSFGPLTVHREHLAYALRIARRHSCRLPCDSCAMAARTPYCMATSNRDRHHGQTRATKSIYDKCKNNNSWTGDSGLEWVCAYFSVAESMSFLNTMVPATSRANFETMNALTVSEATAFTASSIQPRAFIAKNIGMNVWIYFLLFRTPPAPPMPPPPPNPPRRRAVQMCGKGV